MEMMWHSPLLQAVATLRANGQVYCAEECQRIYDLLHAVDPSERSEVKILRALISRLVDGSTETRASGQSEESDGQMNLEIPGLEL